jgi:tRNA wybutosine-synthesizing protein 3
MIAHIAHICKSAGQHWTIRVVHVERVKWYAPHIRHIVVDIQCSVTTTAAG